MCLDYLTEFPITKNYGYKIFSTLNNKLDFLYQDSKTGVKKRRWLVASKGWLTADFQPKSYKKGFHIYENLSDARMNMIGPFYSAMQPILFRVVFKDVVAVGREDGMNVIVAKRIFVMEEVKSTST